MEGEGEQRNGGLLGCPESLEKGQACIMEVQTGVMAGALQNRTGGS